MAVRKRFTEAELAILVIGARVEWRNGRHWHPATVTGEVVRRDGWDECLMTTHAQTATMSAGQTVTGTPGCVRASSYVEPSRPVGAAT